jgi:tetratricopeptide (TPR) repeat protein
MLTQQKPSIESIPAPILKAEILRQKGELDEAMREVVGYMNDHFDDVPALMTAAHILMDAKRTGLAQVLLKRAAALSPNESVIWNNLGLCYQEGSNLSEGEAHFFRSLKLEPDNAMTHANLSQLYVSQAQPALAIKHAERALNADPDNLEAQYNHGLANLLLGNWEGWEGFEANLGKDRSRKERIYGMVPRWNGVEGKTVIAYGEQGIGDEISFASCLPDLLKNNKVIIDCDPKLKGLFKRSFNGETHGTRFDDQVSWVYEGRKLRKIDASVAFGSLPRFYRKKDEDFSGKPYLVADPERRLQWRALLDSLGTKPKVGIAWTGGLKNTGSHRRSLDLDDFLPILRQDATFVSLQYKDASQEVEALKKAHGITVHHWKHAVNTDDYDDTAALVAELDLVISVTTGVIHLCGALGKECWVMVPKAPRWFYGITGNKLPWYQSVNLYRQKAKWIDVIAEVATDVRKRWL